MLEDVQFFQGHNSLQMNPLDIMIVALHSSFLM
jgi:hypothetical protein